MQGDRAIIGLIFWTGLLAYAASVAASLWFAWKGKPRHLGAAYSFGWGLIIAAMMWLLSGAHGGHPTESGMLAWGLAYLLPFFALASIAAAFAAGAIFFVGEKYRSG